jgi:SAM-dependent methyltransferase
MSLAMRSLVDLIKYDRVLDCGGWFIPLLQATHVVDLMPYETRNAKISLHANANERFTKKSWYQLNFTDKEFKLPFDDNYFDFVYCGHTLEDLKDPSPLIKEMARVGNRGLIVCPSRLSEQTVGLRDRSSNNCGHPHHSWIVDEFESKLRLCSKFDSKIEKRSNQIPLIFYENISDENDRSEIHFKWEKDIDFMMIFGSECDYVAQGFVDSLGIKRYCYIRDSITRLMRRTRNLVYGRNEPDWWTEIVKQSLPYSSIEIR